MLGMRGAHRIGKDALAWMKRVGAGLRLFRFDFGRFGFWQGTNSRVLALPQMTPERRCQRGKFRRVTIVGH